MSRQFDAAVAKALEIERELRLLTPDRPSLRCFIAECLVRAGAEYDEVEAVKERLAEKLIAHLGDPGFARLRLGIGHPGVRELVTPYVLSSPPSHERLAIEAAIDTAIEHLPRILDGDLESVMNHLHRRAPEAPAAD